MNIPRALEFKDDKLIILNQTKLPLIEEYIITDDYERIALAIERLEVRGAPAIGIAAAYALALSIKNIDDNIEETFIKAYNRLYSTRPTAVNLFYGLNEIKKVFENHKSEKNLYSLLIKRGEEIHNDDIKMCDDIAKNGLKVFKKKSRVLTHCNTGALATGGNGTALNVIRLAYEKGLVEFVHVDETRPLLQGSRLTAWELNKMGIPFSINTDSTAAFLMKEGKVDLVIVGADRIALNGDTANKIGTYNLAVLCHYHNIPFYIAAPSSTIDKNCVNGSYIKIEMRNKNEITHINNYQITLQEFDAYCPAFDITPAELITGIITEKELYLPPYNFNNV
ncbi:S-methyl-5-thioribose-1-phosphate isomerase [Rosettibacter firmus]|uniref:S-methyl-5-thioribose-1-phosphate isomerase n=1 Tax=Rosettibacter firmus TaxID=3111522 RepID=UPI00336BB07B